MSQYGIQSALIDTTNEAVRVVQAVPLSLSVSGITVTLPAVLTVSGTITNAALTDVWDNINHVLRISNPTVVQGASNNNAPWAVSGAVTVANFPASQTVAGSVTALGNGVRVALTPTLAVATYAASGQLLGGKLTAAAATRVASGLAFLQSIVVTDKANQKAAIDVVLFSTNPTSTTFTDHLGLTVNAADLVNIAGRFSILSTDYSSFLTNAEATKAGLAHEVYSSDGNIYVALVCRGTPTWASASDLQVTLSFVYIS